MKFKKRLPSSSSLLGFFSRYFTFCLIALYLHLSRHVFRAIASSRPWYVPVLSLNEWLLDSKQLIFYTNSLSPFTGKRIALPTRVEPKVFFANERTFLSWLNFTVILGGLAVGLLNFGDRIGRISAALFTLVAMATMAYALVTYHWRAAAIRRRGSGPYDDRFGPTMLCFFLLAAVIVNFVLRMRG